MNGVIRCRDFHLIADTVDDEEASVEEANTETGYVFLTIGVKNT